MSRLSGAAVSLVMAGLSAVLACTHFAPTETGGGPRDSNDGGVLDSGDSGDSGGVSGASYRSAVLADKPIGYWRFGAASGTVVLDESGRKNDGALHGPILGAQGAITGDPDTAATFTNNAYATLGTDYSFAGRATYSIEVWLKPSPPTDVNWHHIFTKEDRESLKHGYALVISAGTLKLERYAAGDDEVGATADAVEPNLFSHVVATYDGENIRLYVNRNLVKQVADPREATGAGSVTVVGAEAVGGLMTFAGVIDELAVYDRALSDARIRVHYEIGRGL